MIRLTALRRLLRRSRAEQSAIIEAFATLAYASFVVAVLPFARVAAIARRPVKRAERPHVDREIAIVAWAITAAASRARFRAVCIERGMAAHIMLRRRGIASTFHYGIARETNGGLTAHVWVRAKERDVMGGPEAAGFHEVAVFRPGDDARLG